MMSKVEIGIQNVNCSTDELIAMSLARNESTQSTNGALRVETGVRTGRSPKLRYIVEDNQTRTTVNWGAVNQPINQEIFTQLRDNVTEYLTEKETFISHLQVGADPVFALPVTVTTEYAWHNLFCQHLFMKRNDALPAHTAPWELISAPTYQLDKQRDGIDGDGIVIINLTQRKVLLCGMRYAGEMKKAMFTVLNYFLPKRDVLPMHCAANVGEKNDVALFFGLSGTGKTTLSADPERFLIGDDEHGWSSAGVFNFEGGCYAKCINLSPVREPVIFNAIRQGAVMENVVLDNQGQPDYTDTSLTQNSRAAYPREHIDKRVLSNMAGIPQAVIFLTCDLFGVLPPVALLSKEQAAYYFLNGYTALVGSTEVGSSSAIQSTFSTCFGAPFFPRQPTEYAELLIKRIEESGAQVYLINTGWTGGAFGQGGKRFDIPVTRSIVAEAISGRLCHGDLVTMPGFNFQIPVAIKGIESSILDPAKNWADQTAFNKQRNELISLFNDNFSQYKVSDAINTAAPVCTE